MLMAILRKKEETKRYDEKQKGRKGGGAGEGTE